jgi:hypothetical protein
VAGTFSVTHVRNSEIKQLLKKKISLCFEILTWYLVCGCIIMRNRSSLRFVSFRSKDFGIYRGLFKEHSEQVSFQMVMFISGKYCEITFIRGVPIFVGRLIHEIKNSTNNETCEAARHRYIGKCCPRISGPAA